MAYLRKTIQKQILDKLEECSFPASVFKTNFDSDVGNLAEITFTPYPEYTFTIGEKDFRHSLVLAASLSQERDVGLYVEQSPHQFKSSSKDRMGSIESCINAIPAWALAISEELSASSEMSKPQNDDLNFIDEALEHVDVNERFTETEIADMESRLSEMEEKLKQAEIFQNETLGKFKDLEAMIEELKAALSTYPKRTWWGLSKGRLLELREKVSKSERLKKAGDEGVKTLVAESIKAVFKGVSGM